MYGRIVNIYEPEQLKAMKPDAITEMINKDIYEDADARQEAAKLRFKGNHRAENLETALFMCPHCRKIGTLKSSGNHFGCECGLGLEFTEYGTFEPAAPFRTVGEWDEWQHEYRPRITRRK